MPTLDDTGRPAIRVAPSAPLELMWIIHLVGSESGHQGLHPAIQDLRERLRPELVAIVDGVLPGYATDLVVLAHRSGTLLDLDLTEFFARLDDAIEDRSPLPSLRSELKAEVEIVRGRLERLRADGALRERYVELLHRLWGSVQDGWEIEGRSAVIAESERWARSLGGAGYRQIVDLAHLWPGRPQLNAATEAAAASGNLVLNPCWFGGKIHVIELDDVVYAGRGIRPGESYRKVAAEISASIKALADPTRLAILLRLARDPASVTEIARQFDLSQPTVSAHVQVLREAGLLEERTVGRSAKLSASEEGLRRLFSNAQESLLDLFRD